MVEGTTTDLLARARGGGADAPAALGELFERCRNYLHLLARTQIDLHLERRASPADVVQQTFLEAHRDFGSFRGDSEHAFLAWLRRILLNNVSRLVEREVLTQKRDLRREISLERTVAALESSAASFQSALASRWRSPSSVARHREASLIVADRLARLPDAHREVIVLRNLEGLPFDEVARRMDRTAGAVRMLWLRALRRLRDSFTEEDLL